VESGRSSAPDAGPGDATARSARPSRGNRNEDPEERSTDLTDGPTGGRIASDRVGTPRHLAG